MSNVVIHHRVDSHEQNASDNIFAENAVAYVAHRYPSTSLNSFQSHIQPHFVVFKTGQKVSESNGPDGILPTFPTTDRIADLLLCRQLYEFWSRAEVPREFFSIPSSSSRGCSDQRNDDDLARDLLDEEDRTHPPDGRQVTRSSRRSGTNDDTNQTPDLERDDLPSGNSTIITNNAASMAAALLPDSQTYEWKIDEWATAGAAEAEVRGWETNLFNDQQISYAAMEESF